MLAGEGTPDEVVEKRGLAVVSDDGALGAAVDNAIAANPDVADKIRDGKVAAAGALIGAVMKEMRGQADAGRVRELILEKLVLTPLWSAPCARWRGLDNLLGSLASPIGHITNQRSQHRGSGRPR